MYRCQHTIFVLPSGAESCKKKRQFIFVLMFFIVIITLVSSYWRNYRYPGGYVHGIGLSNQGETLFVPHRQMRCDETQTQCTISVGNSELVFQLNPAYFAENAATQISVHRRGCQEAAHNGQQIACDIDYFSSHPIEWGPYVNLEISTNELNLTGIQRLSLRVETFFAYFSMGKSTIWKPIVALLAIFSGIGLIIFLTNIMETRSWIGSSFAALIGVVFGAISLPIWYILLLSLHVMLD